MSKNESQIWEWNVKLNKTGNLDRDVEIMSSWFHREKSMSQKNWLIKVILHHAILGQSKVLNQFAGFLPKNAYQIPRSSGGTIAK